jgi:uncharacterized protein YjbI with pentapeptide repeats
MKRRTSLGIGLAVGVGLGFCVRPCVVRPARLTKADVELLIAMMAPTTQEEQSARPLWRLVGQSRVGLVDPRGDYYMAWLEGVDFRRADLREADLSWATIRRCDFRGTNLEHADLSDATFDARTHWPAGFDPEEHGASPAE